MSKNPDPLNQTLSELMQLQAKLVQLPDKVSILKGVCRELKIPGLQEIKFTLTEDGSISVGSQDLSDSIYQLVLKYEAIQIAAIQFQISDAGQFDPYKPYLENFCEVLAATIQLKQQKTPDRMKELEQKLKECMMAEEKLDKTEALFQAALMQSPSGILIADAPNVKIRFANAAAFGIRGKSDQPLTEIEMDEHSKRWSTFLPDGTTPYPPEELPLSRAIFKGETIEYEELIIKNEKGEARWVSTNAAPICDSEKNIIAGIVVFHDITERKFVEKELKNSQEKWDTLFNSMTEMVVLHDVIFDESGIAVNYKITDCNKAYSEITGVKKKDAVGKLATEVYQTEEAPYLHEFTQVGITGQPYEYSTYYAPMDKHFLISVVSPQKNKFATITTDITAIKQIEEVVSSKNKELENYLYVASHDLRSPLVNIQGFSQLLKGHTETIQSSLKDASLEKENRKNLDRIFTEEIPKTLDFIYASVTKMDNLIKGLLQISRTGRMIMSITLVDVKSLIEKVMNSYAYEIEENQIDVEIDELPACYGDEMLLNQLFSNIIGNAIKYKSTERKSQIKIGSKTVYNQVIYSVSDNGIGIAPRHLEKIWDVFFQVNPKHAEKGDGIGLSIVKRIADKHKGRIKVESEENKGTTFYIELQKNEFSE